MLLDKWRGSRQSSHNAAMPEVHVQEMCADPERFRSQTVAALADPSAFTTRQLLDREQAMGLIKACASPATVSSGDIRLDRVEVEREFPLLARFAGVVVGESLIDSGMAETSYSLRPRGNSPNENLPHYDNGRTTFADIEAGRLHPGVRTIVFLGDTATSSVMVETNETRGTCAVAVLSPGDAWSIPQDRYIGLPMRTDEGVVHARHPKHGGAAEAPRWLLIQDVTLGPKVSIDAPGLTVRSVLPHIPSACMMRDERESLTRQIRDSLYAQWVVE